MMAMAGATCGGLAASITRALSDTGIEATRVNQFRFIFSFVVLLVVLRVAAPHLMRIPREARRQLLLAGVLTAFGTGLAYILSLTLLPIATAQAIIYTSPIMLLGVAAVLSRAWPTPLAAGAVALAVGGCWLVVNASAGGDIDPVGVAAALISAASFVGYVTIIQRLPVEMPAVSIVFVMFSVAAVCLALVPDPIWTFPVADTTATEWLGLVGVGTLATFVPYLLFAGATLRLPGPVVGVLATLEPVVAVTTAWITLDQALSPAQILGVVIVLCAATVAQLPGFAPTKAAA